MTSIETPRVPSPRERKALGVALCALGGVVALLIWFRPESVMLMARISGLGWCASILFNREEPLRRQGMGALVPFVAGLTYGLIRITGSPALIAIVAAVALVTIGVAVFFLDGFGSKFSRTWTLLFLPLAWSVSTFLLVLVYYGVITPVGLILRLAGRDPMHRRFDRHGASYWVKRGDVSDPDRYFRQF